MKVFIKNKIWSIGGGSQVLNEEKQPVFKVKAGLLASHMSNMFVILRVKGFLKFAISGLIGLCTRHISMMQIKPK